MPPSSVTTWVERVRAGDAAAATPLWQRYHARLVQLAREHLLRRVRQAGDEEDVALSAFASFCAGVAAGRFPAIGNRDDLWRLLFSITLHKARDHARREGRQRHGSGRTIRAADLLDLPDADLDRLAGAEPDPAWAAAVADQFAHLVIVLPGDDLRRVAQLQLDGYTAAEIARQLGCSLRTVERKWRGVRQFWAEHADD
jgi:DNA-directed RNA polymerase specialized sigma24 family protein